ncbi:MAG TPA: ATP-binding protein [Bryobacteraceae bacterium]|nr:ATP-binding protein [Bryobacteraceae bacterium]
MTLPPRHSLLGKIVLSTSVAITLLLAAAGWFVQDVTRRTLSENLRAEVQGSLRAYESLWQARKDNLRSISRALSNMSDVRRAFQTNDRATIQDTAAEFWSRVAQNNGGGVFLVTDPQGEVIASLGGKLPDRGRFGVVRDAARRFPEQSDGFSYEGGRLYELVVTPVYVQTQGGSGLLNVLVAGFPVDETVARDLKDRTGGSEFVFLAGGLPVTSTLSEAETRSVSEQYRRSADIQDLQLPEAEYAVLGTTLRDFSGAPAGDLLILHNYDSIRRDLNALETRLLLIWVAAVIAGLAVSVLLARRILRPIRQLDQAAALIAGESYGAQVPVHGDDELGRLARTFNAMSGSIQSAREELIRRERISTIGQLSSSIVHDLRNPLASIYGGAEMMMDGDLSPDQLQRLAGNIYRSSRVINEMLRELADVSRGRISPPETCRLSEVVGAAVDILSPAAAEHGVTIRVSVDESIELPLERARMERVFLNLISNAIEAMPAGGEVSISAVHRREGLHVEVRDTGPGIPESVRARLFQPFVTSGKNGLGLGLALSRQTLLDHGGDLWAESNGTGAHFHIRLPTGPVTP